MFTTDYLSIITTKKKQSEIIKKKKKLEYVLFWTFSRKGEKNWRVNFDGMKWFKRLLIKTIKKENKIHV